MLVTLAIRVRNRVYRATAFGRRPAAARPLARGMAMKAGAHEDLKTRLWRFMEAHIYPNEQLFLTQQREIGEASNEWYNPPILVSAAPGLALTP